MANLRDGVLDLFEGILTFFYNLFEPLLGIHSWGWAIIALTVVVRIFLLPLAIKQTRSMRAMQRLQPQMREVQKKYKVDRELMRKDPEQYRARRAKLNEEMMALYRREGANPAASCLPLLAQAPVFIALFWTLRWMEELEGQPFYFVTAFTSVDNGGLEVNVSQAGWPGWFLILLMSGTLFWSQKQMMARTAATQADNPMAQQQKILLYAMPIFLAVISFQFPLGILLYWVTTNFWQVAQQAIILREVKQEAAAEATTEQAKPESDAPPRRRSPGASSGKRPSATSDDDSSNKSTPADKTNDSSDSKPGKDAAKPGKDAAKSGGDAGSGEHGATEGATESKKDGPKRDSHLPRRRRTND